MKTDYLKIEFFCGTTVDRNGNPLPVRFIASAKEAVERDLLAAFDGFSVLPVTGAWRAPGSDVVRRDVSLNYTVVTSTAASRAGAVTTAQELKERFQTYFNQESVLLVITPVFAQF